MSDIENILSERKKTHGDFSEVAATTQDFKNILRFYKQTHPYSCDINLSQQEALDMIFHKISRILCGNSFVKDHWVDIAGYATLIVKQLEKEENDR